MFQKQNLEQERVIEFSNHIIKHWLLNPPIDKVLQILQNFSDAWSWLQDRILGLKIF